MTGRPDTAGLTPARSCVKIIRAGDSGIVLQQGLPERPAGRFNRPGQDALYLSPDELSARVAIGQYITEADRNRELLSICVSACRLLDLREPVHSALYEFARQPWIAALDAGTEPASWQAADQIRSLGYDGLIDPSRRRPGLWHITLFRWNRPGAPTVRITGAPRPIRLDLDFR